MTVWSLETQDQLWAIEEITLLYESAKRPRGCMCVSHRNFLKKLYEDDWKTIKERMETEGSDWYVWFMDGVNRYLQLVNEWESEK